MHSRSDPSFLIMALPNGGREKNPSVRILVSSSSNTMAVTHEPCPQRADTTRLLATAVKLTALGRPHLQRIVQPSAIRNKEI